MRHIPGLVSCIAIAAMSSGCMTRTVEIRPVAPVAESRAIPVAERAGADASPQLSGASGAGAQESSAGANGPGNSAGVRVEAVIPGVYSGRSLSFERDDAPR